MRFFAWHPTYSKPCMRAISFAGTHAGFRRSARILLMRARNSFACAGASSYGSCVSATVIAPEQSSPALKIRFDRVLALLSATGIDDLRELAELIGVDKSTLWRIQTGRVKPSADVIAKLSAAFPLVPLGELVEVVR